MDNINSIGLHLTTKKEAIRDCNIYITTVPTPKDKHNGPVLTPMINASKTIAVHLSKGDIKHSLASLELAKNRLGYNPYYSVEQGINIIRQIFLKSI